jgi:catechol 2,3-dioxygenase-like lactoylglutathione lyase family enzyme
MPVFTGAHVIIYSREADADRAFLLDALGLANVDAGDGWLIFKLPPAELAIHPTEGEPKHELYFLCDDIDATLATLAANGATRKGDVTDQGWGLLATVGLPSGTELALYEPRHPTAHKM